MELTQAQLEKMIADAVAASMGEYVPPPVKTPFDIPNKADAVREIGEASRKEKRNAIGRCARALAASRGDVGGALSFMKSAWGSGDNDLATKILVVGSDQSGGFTVPEVLSDEFIEMLTEQSVFLKMGPRMIPMAEGNKIMNGMATGATAQYQGELDAITPSTHTFRRVSLAAKKLTCMVPISNDLLRTGRPSADGLVRANMIEAMVLRQDLAFIRGDGINNTPVGLRNVPGINATAMTATPTFITVRSDVANMKLRMRNNLLVGGKLGWLMAPRTASYLENIHEAGSSYFPYKDEIEKGMFAGYPFLDTTQIPINLGSGTDESEIYLVDWNRVFVGDTMSLTLDVSTEASYVEGSTTRSAFQNDMTLIRAIAEHDMGVDYAAAIEVLTGVTWAP